MERRITYIATFIGSKRLEMTVRLKDSYHSIMIDFSTLYVASPKEISKFTKILFLLEEDYIKNIPKCFQNQCVSLEKNPWVRYHKFDELEIPPHMPYLLNVFGENSSVSFFYRKFYRKRYRY